MEKAMPPDQVELLDRAQETTRRFRTAGETHDVEMLMETLAPDVVFHSPLTQRTSFEGHDDIRDLMHAAFATIQDIHYHTDVGDERTRTIASTGRIGDQELEEAALIRLNENAKIVDITMWIRPLPAATALMAGIGPRLARRFGRPRAATLISVMTRPLVFVTRMGDRQAVSLVKRRS
jgi:hypothetical protein